MSQVCGCHVKMSDDDRTTTYKSIGADIKAPVVIEFCPLHQAAPALLAAAVKALRYFESHQTGERDTKRNLTQAIATAEGR